MKEIARIIIKGESGYGCIDDAYSDKITITPDSICYLYKPAIESETHIIRKWSYKTNSPLFLALFQQISNTMTEILNPQIVCDCTDIGATEFIVVYSDKSKETRTYFCPADEFDSCFNLIRHMIPESEMVPELLRTYEDE